MSQSLLRATRAGSALSPSCHHRFQPSYITTRLSLPPTLHRIHHGRRPFHWQSTINNAIEGTQGLIADLHTVTHLPWFLTIPLVAFGVGTIFRLPFTIYTQRILQRRTHVNSLLQAWHYQIQRDVGQRSLMSVVKTRQDQVQKRIYRKLGLQEWRLYASLLSFPFWLVAIDGVRRLCGGPRGLIGSLVTQSFAGDGGGAMATDTDAVMASSLPPDSSVASPMAETAHAAAVDPSLTFEGCLWFTDLTASDPYHILPFALSATLLWNVLPKSRGQFSDRVRIAMGRRPTSNQARVLAGDEKVGFGERARSTLYLTVVGFASLIGPLTLDLPAALHLYWLTSALTHALFMRGLQHLMPIQGRLVKRCSGRELPVIWPKPRPKEEEEKKKRQAS